MHYFHPLAKLERQRKKCLESFFPEPLLPLLQQPIWHPKTRLEEIEFLVLDFETTGLDYSRDEILSIGWVLVRNGQIFLDSARKIDIFATEKIKSETAVITHIVPETLAYGEPIDQAIEQLLISIKGRVLIAHSVPIERGFILQYCKHAFGISSLPIVWLDTLCIEKSLVRRRAWNRQGDYRLSIIRADYGLPNYPGHDALTDAVAAGELFLAQVKYVFGNSDSYLGPMFERSLPRQKFMG